MGEKTLDMSKRQGATPGQRQVRGGRTAWSSRAASSR